MEDMAKRLADAVNMAIINIHRKLLSSGAYSEVGCNRYENVEQNARADNLPGYSTP